MLRVFVKDIDKPISEIIFQTAFEYVKLNCDIREEMPCVRYIDAYNSIFGDEDFKERVRSVIGPHTLEPMAVRAEFQRRYGKSPYIQIEAKTLHAVSDGKVLRPEEAVNLEPNVRYLVTIEREEAIGEQRAFGMYLASSLERLKGQEIGQKSMTIIYMAHPSVERGDDNTMNLYDKNRKPDQKLIDIC